MSFNPNDYITPYITLEEVLEIKKAFDLFDRDLGGAIDPRGIALFTQNLKLPSTPSVSKPKLKLFIKWSQNSTRTAADKSNSPNSSTWWPPDPLTTNPEMKFTRFSSPSTPKRLVIPHLFRIYRPQGYQKSCQGSWIINRRQRPPGNDRKSWLGSRWSRLWGRVLQPHYQKSPLIQYPWHILTQAITFFFQPSWERKLIALLYPVLLSFWLDKLSLPPLRYLFYKR